MRACLRNKQSARVTANLGTTEPVCFGLCWLCPHEEMSLRNYQFFHWNATCKVPPASWSCHQGEQGQLHLFLPLPMFMEIAFVLLEFILTLFQTWRKVAKIAQSISTCSSCGYFLPQRAALCHTCLSVVLSRQAPFPPSSCLYVYIYIHVCAHPFVYLSPTCPSSSHLSVHPPTYASISPHVSISLSSVYPSLHPHVRPSPSTFPSIYLHIYPSPTYPLVLPPTHPSISHPVTHLSTHIHLLPTHPPTDPSLIHLPIHPFIHLPGYLYVFSELPDGLQAVLLSFKYSAVFPKSKAILFSSHSVP